MIAPKVRLSINGTTETAEIQARSGTEEYVLRSNLTGTAKTGLGLLSRLAGSTVAVTGAEPTGEANDVDRLVRVRVKHIARSTPVLDRLYIRQQQSIR